MDRDEFHDPLRYYMQTNTVEAPSEQFFQDIAIHSPQIVAKMQEEDQEGWDNSWEDLEGSGSDNWRRRSSAARIFMEDDEYARRHRRTRERELERTDGCRYFSTPAGSAKYKDEEDDEEDEPERKRPRRSARIALQQQQQQQQQFDDDDIF